MGRNAVGSLFYEDEKGNLQVRTHTVREQSELLPWWAVAAVFNWREGTAISARTAASHGSQALAKIRKSKWARAVLEADWEDQKAE